MDKIIYDVIIIGGGPGGYTAALYAARAGLTALVLEKFSPGGQMATTEQVDNYPGFEIGIDGFDLGEKMKLSAERFGVKTEFTEVLSVQLTTKPKIIHTTDGDLAAQTVILALGAAPRELGLPDEQALRNRGLAYCATCDGLLYKGKTVVVVGGGNSAVAEALFLAKICTQVYLLHRGQTLNAQKAYFSTLEAATNVTLMYNTEIQEILSAAKITGVRLTNRQTQQETTLACQGIFVAIGRTPNTAMFKGILDLDEQGYIVADETTRTNVPGVFAVGDIRTTPLRQIITAAADGAVASKYAEEYLATLPVATIPATK
ncbi:MAG: thioredoxin-disulfide reductase [Acidaminococcaceae bacterium]